MFVCDVCSQKKREFVQVGDVIVCDGCLKVYAIIRTLGLLEKLDEDALFGFYMKSLIKTLDK